MTNDQLQAVLEWKYPSIGKAYRVVDGHLEFMVWQDRTTGQPSTESKPTLTQCEAWLPDLPTDFGKNEVCGNWFDEKLQKAFALVVLDEVNILRSAAGLVPRTATQLRNAVLAKYKTL